MAAESLEEQLRQLTGAAGESATEIYATWAGLTVSGDESLERLVRHKLTANGKAAQLRESLLATVKAGGGIGESLEQCLAKSGLLGWS